MIAEPDGSIVRCMAFYAGVMDRIAEAVQAKKPDVAALLWSASEHIDEATVLFESAMKQLLGKQEARQLLHPNGD